MVIAGNQRTVNECSRVDRVTYSAADLSFGRSGAVVPGAIDRGLEIGIGSSISSFGGTCGCARRSVYMITAIKSALVVICPLEPKSGESVSIAARVVPCVFGEITMAK